MNENNRYRLPRMQERTFIRKPYKHAYVMDRINLLQLGLRGWQMDKEEFCKRFRERLEDPNLDY